MPGHELIGEGAAHHERGYPIHFFGGIGGFGFGVCSCGAKSPALDSGNQRKAWHRAHKEALRKESRK